MSIITLTTLVEYHTCAKKCSNKEPKEIKQNTGETSKVEKAKVTKFVANVTMIDTPILAREIVAWFVSSVLSFAVYFNFLMRLNALRIIKVSSTPIPGRMKGRREWIAKYNRSVREDIMKPFPVLINMVRSAAKTIAQHKPILHTTQPTIV